MPIGEKINGQWCHIIFIRFCWFLRQGQRTMFCNSLQDKELEDGV
jgi:hypothetical protein